MTLKWTTLTPRQLIKFYDPANTGNFFIPQLNPVTEELTPGNLRKYTQTVNGGAVIIGKKEAPPSEIKLSWAQIDYSDVLGIVAFTALSPIVFIDNNDRGFLGVLVVDKAQQLVGMTSNVWSLDASFLVIGPFNGQTTTLTQLAGATLAYSLGGTSSGFLPNATTLYFWATSMTKFGESVVGPTLTATTTHTNDEINLTWTQPSSNYFQLTRLYWNTVNNAGTATFLTEVMAGFTGNFAVKAPYVVYSTVVPPTYGSAFRGYFAGGLYIDDPTG